MNQEILKIANDCEAKLNLKTGKLSEEYFYNSLPFCIIDAVFSIGVRYSSTRKVVINYCDFFQISRLRPDKNAFPSTDKQESIKNMIDRFDKYGVDFICNSVFKNRQRTSPRNGILKGQAVYEYCKVFSNYDIAFLQDFKKVIMDSEFEAEIKSIKGQSSGIALQYLFMLAGSDGFIKPDRMILRFLETSLGRHVSLVEAQKYLTVTTEYLKSERGYKHLSPRLLDHLIWNFQRTVSQS